MMLAATLALLLQAAGQTAPTTGPGAGPMPDQASPTVIVTGRRPDSVKELRHMTATVTPVGDAEEPLARFETSVCPAVNGLTEPLDKVFADRIREAARSAGLRVEAPGCTPNITVLVVANGQAVVRELRRTHSAVFGDLDPPTINRLSTDPSPAHLWAVTELRSRDGDRMTGERGNGAFMYTRDASIIDSSHRIDIDTTVLLIDQAATIGKTINQLADYAAMRTLTQAREPKASAAEPTILSLFDPGGAERPRGLTRFDTAYLKALYHGAATERPLTKVGLMARSINSFLANQVTGIDATPPMAGPSN